MELTAFLYLLATGGGAAWAAYALIGRVAWLAAQGPRAKREWAIGISAGSAVLAYLGLMAVREVPVPADWVGWASQVFYIGTSAFGLSQYLHMQELPVTRVHPENSPYGRTVDWP